MKDSVIQLAAELVRIPSRAGSDRVEPIAEHVMRWFEQRQVAARLVRGPRGRVLGVAAAVESGKPGPQLVLDACLDTAPFGDETRWSRPPTAGEIDGGRLYGRGAADSKMGVALFAHLLPALRRDGAPRRGVLHALFDADEHSGEFGGVKRFVAELARPPDAFVIGYPGNERIVVGARGFQRGRITVFGTATHSGSKEPAAANAVVGMARLVSALAEAKLPRARSRDFPLGPKLNVTAIGGGSGFSQVPDRCVCHVDLRLTPGFDADAARSLVQRIVAEHDRHQPGPLPSTVDWLEGWPAYRLEPDAPIAAALGAAAKRHFRREIPPAVVGPSNIGNYLATLGIPALAGFGVGYGNLHGADEWAALEDVEPVFATYREAVSGFLGWLRTATSAGRR